MAQGNKKPKGKDKMKELGKATQFGKGNDPSNAGKKGGSAKSLIVYLRDELGVELGINFSKASIEESLAVLITTPMATLKELKNNDTLPAHLSIYVNALIKDKEQGRFSTVSELMDRVYGKSKEEIKLVSEMTTEELLRKNKELDAELDNIRNIKRD